MKTVNFKNVVLTILMLPLLLGVSAASAHGQKQVHGLKKQQVEPIELIIDFKIAGEFVEFNENQEFVYTIEGPGYAPSHIFRSGEITDKINPHRQVTELQGAQITFAGNPLDPVVRFSCLPGSCTMPFADGSVLTSDAGVPLEGRSINFWGPVVNSPDYDEVNQISPIRIMGCGGLKEITGTGKYAGMVGSICFNGVLNNSSINPFQLTGSSKCTITLHTPQDPNAIP